MRARLRAAGTRPAGSGLRAGAGASCRPQPVADSPDRLEQLWMRRVALELLAQAANVNRHRARVERGRVTPDALHQLLAREDAVRVRGEEPQQLELLRRQAERLAVAPRLARDRVDHDRP